MYDKLLPSGYITLFISPHRSTTHADAAYCYRPSSVVCWSVCRSVTEVSHAKMDGDAVWLEDSSGPKEPCITWGLDQCMGRGYFEGGKGVPL